MAVYVDNSRYHYGRMIMCHMLADNPRELLKMADAIGLDRAHLQHAGTYSEHFDVCLAKRAEAIKRGAVEIGRRQLCELLQKKRCKE